MSSPTPSSSNIECGSDHCITCSDEGVPMRVVALGDSAGLVWCTGLPEAGSGEVGTAAERSEVMTMLVEPVAVGDTLLVHAGTALLRIVDQAEVEQFGGRGAAT